MRGRLTAIWPILTGFLVLLALSGCGTKESFTLSSRVEHLWRTYPSPWDSASASNAAREASALLREYPRDFQLARYYMDRMERIDPVTIGVEFDRMRLEHPQDARWMVLDALANASRNELFDLTRVALEKAPEDPYVLIEHARAVLGRRPVMLEDATDLAFQAVGIAPDLPDANGFLAYMLLWVEQPNEALPFIEHAVKLDPWEFRYVETHAMILNKLGKHDEGIDLMEMYHQKHPDNPYAISTLMDRYLADRQWEKMIPLKRIAATRDPANGVSWVELALIFQRLEHIDSTFAALHQAVEDGFIDIPFLEFAFEEDLPSLKADARYASLLKAMRQARERTYDHRKAEALSDPLLLPAPELTATSLEGHTVQLEDLRGDIVILGFWSTWSGWTKITEPRLLQLYRHLPHGVQFVGVNVLERVEPEKRSELVERYTQDRKLPWAVWLADDVTANRFGVQALPSYLVIDREGRIRYHVIGYAPYADEVLGWMIEALQSPEGIAAVVSSVSGE